jgi:hypothetical protein
MSDWLLHSANSAIYIILLPKCGVVLYHVIQIIENDSRLPVLALFLITHSFILSSSIFYLQNNKSWLVVYFITLPVYSPYSKLFKNLILPYNSFQKYCWVYFFEDIMNVFILGFDSPLFHSKHKTVGHLLCFSFHIRNHLVVSCTLCGV